MCGICGVVDFSGPSISKQSLIQMRDALAHRGPDSAGLYIHSHVGLGHRRLKIIDLSQQGTQPFSNEDGSIQLICNGEIYNHKELRAQLLAAEHRFRSQSDNEVLVHGYELWGMAKLMAQLKGMFAFALWDGNRQVLYLARDRLGVKPLFYRLHQGRLLFSSEVGPLYKHMALTPESLDPTSLDYYLAFGYVPPERSIVQGVHKLPPGHLLRFDQRGLECWRYWDIKFRPSNQLSVPEQLEQVDVLLRQAVARRLESDVSLGSFLSSGIDSGLVTALAASSLGKPLRTFSVGFEGGAKDNNELRLARLVAERYGTQHQELIVTPTDISALPRIIWHAGEPYADGSVLALFQICQAARTQITVALTGDGGDESFCGYTSTYTAYLASRLKASFLSPWMRTLLRPFGNRSYLIRRLDTLMAYASKSPLEWHDLDSWWHSGLRSELYGPKRAGLEGALDVVGSQLSAVSDLEDVEQVLYAHLHLRLPGDYLAKMDIASNIVALELRSPFLDHELMSLAASLPLSSKFLGLRPKGLLRQLARRYLPADLIDAPKVGFAPPIGDWLRTNWPYLVKELVLNGIAKRPAWFNAAAVHQVVAEHLNGRRSHTRRLWALMCLEVWWRLFVDDTMHPQDDLTV